MTATIIGISSAFLIISVFIFLKQFDKKIIYGLILAGIGFLYVGFAWTDMNTLIINSIQAIVFVFIGYYGVRNSRYLLAIGFFLHGCWDIIYPFFRDPGLIPPDYDLFCSSLDFVIGIYILLFNKEFSNKSLALS